VTVVARAGIPVIPIAKRHIKTSAEFVVISAFSNDTIRRSKIDQRLDGSLSPATFQVNNNMKDNCGRQRWQKGMSRRVKDQSATLVQDQQRQ
jgi:hypothetical protein